MLDAGTRPRLTFRRERLARRAKLDCGHSRAFRAGELVVRSVADEQALAWLDSELVAGQLVDPRVGLREADRAREDGRVEQARERRPVPDLGDLLRADRDQAELVAARAK